MPKYFITLKDSTGTTIIDTETSACLITCIADGRGKAFYRSGAENLLEIAGVLASADDLVKSVLSRSPELKKPFKQIKRAGFVEAGNEADE